MTSPFDTVYVDLVGPPVSADWLNAVSLACKGAGDALHPTTYTATASQTVFTTTKEPSGFVFVDGVYQIPGSSYTWSGTTLTFSEGIHVGGKVTVL